MNAVSLNNLWVYLQGLTLTADNKRWIADHLYEQARQEDALPYTMEEINARLDRAEADVESGRVLSRAEASKRMKEFISKHS